MTTADYAFSVFEKVLADWSAGRSAADLAEARAMWDRGEVPEIVHTAMMAAFQAQGMNRDQALYMTAVAKQHMLRAVDATVVNIADYRRPDGES